MIENNNESLIDQYIRGDLNKEQCKEVEQRMMDDETFAKEVQFQRDIAVSIQCIGLRELIDKREKALRKRRSRMSVVRVVMPILSIAALITGVFINIHNTDVYIDNAPVIQIEYSRGAEQLSDIAIMINDNELEEAQSKIRSFREASNIDISTTDKPLTQEEQYQFNVQKRQMEYLEWCELTIYMKQGRWIKARGLLKSIIENGGFYSEPAAELLDKL